MNYSSILAAGTVASLLFLSSCKPGQDPTPEPSSLMAKAGADQAVVPVQPVSLDGSNSTGNGPLTYQWSLIRKPGKSTLTLTNSSAAKLSVTPDIVGYYEFELTVSNAAGEKSQDRVQVKAEYGTPITLDKDITTKTRLVDRIIDPAKPDYIVAANISVRSELSVDPDVTIASNRDTRVTIEKDGMLLAIGTADQRIRWVGTTAQKGFWAGLAHYSISTGNILEYVDVQHAGSRTVNANTKAALFVAGSSAQMALKNCQFSDNEGYGLHVIEGGLIREFSTNRFTNHTESGILINANNVGKLDAASVFTGGNARNTVEVSFSTLKGNDQTSWPAFTDKTPYRLMGDLYIEMGLTLQPGVTVEVNRDVTIRINPGGFLSAKGTAANKVTIAGATRTAGFWKGLIFYSVSQYNELEYADIIGGGSVTIVSGQKATVTVYGRGAKLTVQKSHISNSGGYGILYSSDAVLNTDAEAVNTFSSNAQKNLFKL